MLTVSRAIATGRPAWVLSASRALSITDWWYSYEPWEKFMRTTLSPAATGGQHVLVFSHPSLRVWAIRAGVGLTSSESVDGLGGVGLGTCEQRQ